MLLSGGRGLGLPARPRGAAASAAGARSPRCTSTTGCATRRADDERHCAALCERLGVELEVERPRRPEAAATSRPGRATCATRRRLGWREPGEAPDRHRPHRRRPGRDDPLPARLLAEPPGAAGDAPRDGRLVRPLLGFTRAQTTAYCEERGLAWRDDPSNAAQLRAQPRAPRAGPGAEQIHPAAAANVLRTAALLRDEARAARRARRRRARGRAGRPDDRARAAGRAAAGAAPARRRSASPTAPPAARSPAPPARRGGRGPAPHRPRDARPRRRRPRGRRARRARTRSAGALDSAPVMGDASIGETLVQPEDLQRRVARARRRDQRDYAGRDCCWSACSRAPSSSSPTSCAASRCPARSTSWRSPPTARRRDPPASCGSSRISTR